MNKFIKEEKLWKKGTDITNCLVANIMDGNEIYYDKFPDIYFKINVKEMRWHGSKLVPQFFNIIGKGKTRKDQFKSIIKQEENYLIQLFVAASDTNRVRSCKEFTVIAIAELMSVLEEHRYATRNIMVNKKHMANYDIKKGVMNFIYGARFIFNRRFKNMVFAIAEPEFVGVRSLRGFGIIKKGRSKGKLFCYEALSIIYPKAIACMEVKG